MKNKWEPMDPERLKKYREIDATKTPLDYLPKHVLEHTQRMRTINGVGIEALSYMNKDYLGSFMAPFSRDIENADIAIIGIPIEGSSPINSGHKLGPTELRKISKLGMGTVSDKMLVPFDMCRVIDYGNADVFGPMAMVPEIEIALDHCRKIVEAGADLFVWGGDHSISYPPLKALGEKYGPLSVIHFDAHYDMLSRAAYPDFGSSAMFTRNITDGLIDPERMIQVGLRGRMTFLEQGGSDSFGIKYISADEVFEMGVEKLAQEIIDRVGDGPTYFTIDLDVLDPCFHIANSSPEPFGLTTRQIYEVIRRIKDKVNLVGCDIAEYTPMADDANRKDAITACGIGWELFCWLIERRAERQGEHRQTEWPLAMGYASL